MSKYIIKNCPNLSYAIMADGTERNFQCGLEIDKYCQDCTDCLLKQIVEKCKEVNTKFYDSIHQRYLSPSKAKFAREILELLDIQEVK